jgi:hypothetical protein
MSFRGIIGFPTLTISCELKQLITCRYLCEDGQSFTQRQFVNACFLGDYVDGDKLCNPFGVVP